MWIIPVMIRQLKINLQVKYDPRIYRIFFLNELKSVNIQSSYWHLLALRPLFIGSRLHGLRVNPMLFFPKIIVLFNKVNF